MVRGDSQPTEAEMSPMWTGQPHLQNEKSYFHKKEQETAFEMKLPAALLLPSATVVVVPEALRLFD